MDGYDDARRVWNAMIDSRPALIARCARPADVIHAVNFAREHDLVLSVRGGGHSVAGLAVCDGGIMIDLSPMREVLVDPARARPAPRAACTLGRLRRETAGVRSRHDRRRRPTTGIAGLDPRRRLRLALGSYGMASDNLLSADVVTADGRLPASADENPDLFWALRGGGGNFGVVTSFESTSSIRSGRCSAARLPIHLETRPSVLRFYREFAASAPDEITTYCGFLPGPHGPVIAIAAAHCGSLEDGERALAQLKEFGSPVHDAVGPIPYVKQQSLLDDLLPLGIHSTGRPNTSTGSATA